MACLGQHHILSSTINRCRRPADLSASSSPFDRPSGSQNPCRGIHELSALASDEERQSSVFSEPASQELSSRTHDKLDQPQAIASSLRQCRDAGKGRLIHQELVAQSMEKNLFLENLLIQMYGNCDAIEDMHAVFTNLHSKDNFSWNFMISSYAHHGLSEEAIQLFNQMQQEGAVLDSHIFTSIIATCACKNCLFQGMQIHSYLAYCAIELNVAVWTSLLNMYSRCGKLNDARMIFNGMPERNIVTWTSMISAYAQNGQCKDGVELFDLMLQEAVLPNDVTFVSFLCVCGSQVTLAKCKWMHACVIGSGFELDAAMANAILGMYRKCGSMEDAQKMFDDSPVHNTILWNAIITGYIEYEQREEALFCFRNMQQQGVVPNNVTYISLLSAYATQADLLQAQHMHAIIIQSGFGSDVNIGNALINMYAKCGTLKTAQRILATMAHCDLVSWNTIISAYVQHNEVFEALHVYERMCLNGIEPNNVTFISLLSGCTCQRTLAEGQLLHADIIEHGFESEVVVGNALANMYGKCDSLECAVRIFDRLSLNNVTLWSALLAAYAQQGHIIKTFEMFERMYLQGIPPNIVTFLSMLSLCANESKLSFGQQLHLYVAKLGFDLDVVLDTSLIDMYGKCGSLEDAAKIFDNLHDRTTISWNAVIAAHVQHGDGSEALQLFCQMQQEGIMADNRTFASILAACTKQKAIVEGKAAHVSILLSGIKLDLILENTLLNMYANCGELEDAQKVFDQISERDVISWTSMVVACAQHGQGESAVQAFNNMEEEGVRPDGLAFFSILSACSQSGLVKEGHQFFESMRKDYCIEPKVDHYNCMLDLLGRAGHLNDAESLLCSMPCQPSAISWITLFSAYKIKLHVERRKTTANQLFEMGNMHFHSTSVG